MNRRAFLSLVAAAPVGALAVATSKATPSMGAGLAGREMFDWRVGGACTAPAAEYVEGLFTRPDIDRAFMGRAGDGA